MYKIRVVKTDSPARSIIDWSFSESTQLNSLISESKNNL